MNTRKLFRIRISLLVGIPIFLFALINIFGGAGRRMADPIKPGNIEVPYRRSFVYNDSSALQKSVIYNWSKGKTEEWKEKARLWTFRW